MPRNSALGAGEKRAPVNAFSVDVEDYFQVGAFENVVSRSTWDSFELRVHTNTRRLLELLGQFGIQATFFVLGWVAERCPELVREISQSGHELACHGYDHRRLTRMSADELRADIRKTKAILEDVGGVEVVGYRAPSFSIVRETMWAIEILVEEGFWYDASIFPIRHDHYGIPNAPRFPWTIYSDSGSSLIEFPISTVRIAGLNLPFVGGGYLRHLPLAITRWGIRRLNTIEGQPAVVYIHPWEIDPDQPTLDVGPRLRWRHYRNLDKTWRRLEALLEEFPFTSMRKVLGL